MNTRFEDRLPGMDKARPEARDEPGWPLVNLIVATAIWLILGIAIALDYRIPERERVVIPAIPAEPTHAAGNTPAAAPDGEGAQRLPPEAHGAMVPASGPIGR